MTSTALLIAAMQQATLTGVVRDSVDLEPVAYAQVTVSVVAGQATAAAGVSDRYGAFVVPGVAGGEAVRVEVAAFGYAPWTRTYESLPTDPIRVLLAPAPIGIEGIEVNVAGRAGDPISLSRDAFVIDSVLLRTLPAILETDVLRATAVSPSASAPSDYTSVPFIRGGTSEGTPVLLDGVRLFNAFHLGGFLSAINAEVVERATILAGSGGDGLAIGSLSGAIDIATRDGARDEMRMAGSLGLASSRLSVEGPIGNSVSYLLDGRRTYIDGFTLALKKMGVTSDHLPYFFQDLHTKVTADLGGVRRLSVSGYRNSESLQIYDSEETNTLGLSWGNSALSVHYRDRLGDNGIVDANLGHSRFTSDLFALGGGSAVYSNDVRVEYTPPTDTLLFGDGIMSETRADLRVTWRTGRATITSGAQATGFLGDHEYDHTDEFDSDEGFFFSPVDLRESSWRLAAFSSVEVPLQRGFSTRAGLRVDHFRRLATTLAPFAELSYAGSWWDARISASRSHQALASVRDEEALGASFLAYDLLVPVSKAPVPRNTEFTIGWEGSRAGVRVRVDAYARTLDNLRLPALGARPATGAALGDPSLWVVSSGSAKGVETSWSWISDGGLSVLGSYRWARVSRTVGSRTYKPRFHRNHEFELGTSYGRGASSWSARVSLRSGQPTTPVLAVVPVEIHGTPFTELVPLGGEYNSGTLPRYARIDVGWRRESRVSWFGGGSIVPYVSVANLFSLPNVVGGFVERRYSTGDIRRVYVPQLPMIPFFGVEFRF
ncbi:MAG: TonB-dependent receptor [Gemmatimonadota bacterium]|nr:TonB-dependent receptor [Gemmatimonadota bacterium]MDE2984052.1 TonB-dependent receptor [Gemmatimonadota bacterium]